MRQKKRKKWWQLSVLEFSWKTGCYYFLAMFTMIVGIAYGSKEWTINFPGFSHLGREHIIFPIWISIASVFFVLFRYQAKKDYMERNLGHPRVHEKK